MIDGEIEVVSTLDYTLTTEEIGANHETWKHICAVRDFLGNIVEKLKKRGLVHDKSKMERPEVSTFAKYTPKLKNTTYGSDEYKQFLKEMSPALEHHYANNRHHPEGHPLGIDGMNLVDLVEMLCDWKAATLRHDDGDLMKSIEHNTKRFNISPQLRSILENTVGLFDDTSNWVPGTCVANVAGVAKLEIKEKQ
jgi:hypothetical protein